VGNRFSRLGNVYNFSLFDLLTSLGSKLPVRSVRALIAWVLPFITIVFSLGTLALMGFVRTLLSNESIASGRDLFMVVAFGTAVALVYLGVSSLVAEVLTRRRFSVAANPNIELFRALDIRMIDVFAVVAGIRIILFHIALYIVALRFVFTFADEFASSPSLSFLLLLVPTCSLAVALDVAARKAVRADVLRGSGSPIQVALVVVFAVLGWATSVFCTQVTTFNLPHFSAHSLEAGGVIAVSVVRLPDFCRLPQPVP
jgi:hypothetical protein